MKNLKWRLSKLPTPDEVRELVKDKIITQDEAREILFSQESDEERDKDSLKEEIKFLRELVNKMSNRSTIVETIKYIEKPYIQWGWYQPYQVYCSGNGITGSVNTTALNINSAQSQYSLSNAVNTSVNYSYDGETGDFTEISTF